MTTEEKVDEFIEMTANTVTPEKLARFLELGTDENVLSQVAEALAEKAGEIEDSQRFIARVMTLLDAKYGEMINSGDDRWNAGFLTGIQFGVGLLTTLSLRKEFEGMDTVGVAGVTVSVANVASAVMMRHRPSAEWPEVIDAIDD